MATIFEGDNGGATSPGVSATEIRVAVPMQQGTFSSQGTTRQAVVDALFEYVNLRFELYGRRLVPQYIFGSASTAVASRALGTQVATTHPFATVLGLLDRYDVAPQVAIVQELARNQVVTVVQNASTWWSNRLLFDPYHPYVWSVHPPAEELQSHLAATACAMATGTARHTPDANLVGKPRKIGIVAMGAQVAPATDVVSSRLAACTGETPLRAEWVQATDASGTQMQAGLSRLAAGGVTTVVCVCEAYQFSNAPFYASRVPFKPEWVYPTTNYWGGEEYLMQQLTRGSVPPNSVIRTDAGPRLGPLQVRPWFQALLTMNPALVSSDVNRLRDARNMAEFVYPQLLLLASGLQAAGPALTPDTFAAGLMAARFPNPGAVQAPDYLPAVGFGPGDHGFYDGFSVSWWSTTAPAVDPDSPNPQGSWCYVGAGARFRSDNVPADLDAQLYNPAAGCR